MANRPQSPTSPLFVLGSNDDQLERAQARAARAAANRRKAATVSTPSSPPSDPCLSREQIIDLFQNFIKLASENVRTYPHTLSRCLSMHIYKYVLLFILNNMLCSFFNSAFYNALSVIYYCYYLVLNLLGCVWLRRKCWKGK